MNWIKKAQVAALCGLCLWLLCACSMFAPVRVDRGQLLISDYSVYTQLTFQPQKRFQCGPAALAMALEAAGVKVSADRIAPQIYAPALKGSLQPFLISAARRKAVLAYPINSLECLLKNLDSGRPVVVLQNLGVSWLPRWHYSLVVGYDLKAGVVILHTGLKAYRHVSLRTFMNTWRRSGNWGLVLMPPDYVPVCPDQVKWIQAALGLEKAGQVAAARKAYEAILSIWPASLGALMGLGNTSYRLGDLEFSRLTFRQVVERYPQNGDGYNNLAQVLADQGRCAGAIEMVGKALAIGGPHKAIYRLTLEQLQAGGCKPKSSP